MVRIAGFHPADPGSSPGVGILPLGEILVRIPERSKGRDSSSRAICFVGSNPTAYIDSMVKRLSQQTLNLQSWVRIPVESFF